MIYTAGTSVLYHPAGGGGGYGYKGDIPAVVVETSASGKRVMIRLVYTLHDIEFATRIYVKPETLRPVEGESPVKVRTAEENRVQQRASDLMYRREYGGHKPQRRFEREKGESRG